jgi:hypothetical protein
MASNTFITDIFKSEEAQSILKNKYVLFIGDSVIRGMYKDLVKFLQTDQHLLDNQLKNKGEMIFENDELLEGGQKGEMSNDITYSEVREFKRPYHYVKFYFITRCYSDYFRSICDDISNQPIKPDVVIMNSGCWDLTRYGVNSMFEYKQNLPLAMYHLCKVLPSYTLFIWTSILPLSKDVKGGFMVPEVEYTRSKLREDVLEANYYARTVMDQYKLDLIDLHYYFCKQTHRRSKDGIHWDSTSHRRITNIFLNHMCLVWKRDTPGRLTIKNNPDIFIQDNREEIYEGSESNSTTDNSNLSSKSKVPLPSEVHERIDKIKQSKCDGFDNNPTGITNPAPMHNGFQYFQHQLLTPQIPPIFNLTPPIQQYQSRQQMLQPNNMDPNINFALLQQFLSAYKIDFNFQKK